MDLARVFIPHWYVVTASLLTKVIVWAIVGKITTVRMSQRGSENNSGEGGLGPSCYIPDVEEVTMFGRCWEMEESSQQILDVQGRLHAKVKFLKEVLQAPPPCSCSPCSL